MKVYVHEMGTHRSKNKEVSAPMCTLCHINPRYWQNSGAYSLFCRKCRNIKATERYRQKQKV